MWSNEPHLGFASLVGFWRRSEVLSLELQADGLDQVRCKLIWELDYLHSSAGCTATDFDLRSSRSGLQVAVFLGPFDPAIAASRDAASRHPLEKKWVVGLLFWCRPRLRQDSIC